MYKRQIQERTDLPRSRQEPEETRTVSQESAGKEAATTIVTDVTETVISAAETEDLLTTEARDVLRAAARADLQEITTEDR